jgi:hypothetical protein
MFDLHYVKNKFFETFQLFYLLLYYKNIINTLENYLSNINLLIYKEKLLRRGGHIPRKTT